MLKIKNRGKILEESQIIDTLYLVPAFYYRNTNVFIHKNILQYLVSLLIRKKAVIRINVEVNIATIEGNLDTNSAIYKNIDIFEFTDKVKNANYKEQQRELIRQLLYNLEFKQNSLKDRLFNRKLIQQESLRFSNTLMNNSNFKIEEILKDSIVE